MRDIGIVAEGLGTNLGYREALISIPHTSWDFGYSGHIKYNLILQLR